MPTPLENRRQSAREAAYDAVPCTLTTIPVDPMEVGIEVATRVQITHEINSAYLSAWAAEGHRAGMRAAFEAAGFEVVD